MDGILTKFEAKVLIVAAHYGIYFVKILVKNFLLVLKNKVLKMDPCTILKGIIQWLHHIVLWVLRFEVINCKTWKLIF